MSEKKAKEKRRKAKKLKAYMQECFELEMKEWEAAEPCKIRFISHYLWKKREPAAYSASDRHYKKCFK